MAILGLGRGGGVNCSCLPCLLFDRHSLLGYQVLHIYVSHGIWIDFYFVPLDSRIHVTSYTIFRKRRLRPRRVRDDPHHMPPLTILKIRHSAVGDTSLVPNYYGPLLPAYAAAEVEAPDMPVQELEQSVRLLWQEALDAARDRRVHKEAGLTSHGVPDDQRVRS